LRFLFLFLLAWPIFWWLWGIEVSNHHCLGICLCFLVN
jgi:hypothetical protein